MLGGLFLEKDILILGFQRIMRELAWVGGGSVGFGVCFKNPDDGGRGVNWRRVFCVVCSWKFHEQGCLVGLDECSVVSLHLFGFD